MKLTIEKTVTEEIEISVPCYRKYGGSYYHVTDTGVLEVANSQITYWENTGGLNNVYKTRVREAFRGTEITEAEFEGKYNEVIASFKETNQLTVAV